MSTRSSTRSAVAFHDDPVWSWAFPDDERRPAAVPALVAAVRGECVPHGFTWMAERAETVAVWAPPNGFRSSPTRPRRASRRCSTSCSASAPRIVLEGLLQFEAAHPHDEPHYYLGFVATHDDHRGHGHRRAAARAEPRADRRRASARVSRVEQPEEPRRATGGSASCRARSSRCPTTVRRSRRCGARRGSAPRARRARDPPTRRPVRGASAPGG